ncbi:hypothetical protein B0H11DRAFT_2215796 [Mycena galericulata]|nr:hypothetical protein B0H11DRAFT_2215796 [Mycena galericulata]
MAVATAGFLALRIRSKSDPLFCTDTGQDTPVCCSHPRHARLHSPQKWPCLFTWLPLATPAHRRCPLPPPPPALRLLRAFARIFSTRLSNSRASLRRSPRRPPLPPPPPPPPAPGFAAFSACYYTTLQTTSLLRRPALAAPAPALRALPAFPFLSPSATPPACNNLLYLLSFFHASSLLLFPFIHLSFSQVRSILNSSKSSSST